MPVQVTKVGGVATKAFADIPVPSCFEHGARLYAKIPDTTKSGSQTVLNAIRFDDLVVTGFLPTDEVYPATADIAIEYSTATT